MAHKLRPHFFVLISLVFQSFYSSSALVSLNTDSPVSSFDHSLISASAASVQNLQLHACYPADRDALLDVAASFSLGRQYWRQEQDCCHWAGVTCGSPFNSTTTTTSNSSANPKLYSRVVGLTLASFRVDASAITSSARLQLPLSVCQLSALISLDLSSNDLIGPIPTCFSHNLTYLQTLNMSYNFLSGSLSPLANLSLLTHLDLSSNRFTSVGSSIIFSGNLTYMDLSHNSLSGALSALKFHTPCRLEYLNLGANSLSGSSVDVSSFIKGLSTNLRHLDLSYNQLFFSLTPAAFSTTPLLQHLYLGGNEQIITGDIRALEHLQHLEILLLSTLSVPAHSLGSLFCKLGSLQILWVDSFSEELDDDKIAASTVLDDKLLCEKPASVNLTSLELSGQGYTGPFPKWIAHFARLQALGLGGNQFEGPIPQGWQALTQLTYLALSGDSPVTPVPLSQEVQSWLFRLPLEALSLESMGLTSQDFPCAGFSLLNHTLQWLHLSDNHISPGHSLLHCLQHHNFSLLIILALSKNLLALPLQPHMFPMSIQSLDLSYCQLFGSLSSIGTLPMASYISLAHNNLTGSIPSDIGSTLMGAYSIFLDLSYNKLTGIIPSSIWNLTSPDLYNSFLLVLDNNLLHGVLAPSQGVQAPFVSISNNYLSKVSFHNVTLAGVLITNNYLNNAYFHNVSGLGVLDLSSNQLGGTLESLLGDYSVMKNLAVLNLGSNQLKGSIPSSLGTSAPSLITMDLSNNNLTGAIPPSLQHLQALRSKISETALFDFFIAFLGVHVTISENVKNVEFNLTDKYSRGHLDLSCNQLNGSIPDGLGALVGLNDLNLSKNQLSGPIPPTLAHLSSLEELDLSFNNLEGAIPSELLKLTSLEVFNVSFNPKLSGRIPEGPQLETATSYEGDHKLCGQAINKSCSEQQLTSTGLEPNTLPTNLSFKERFASFIQEWIAIPGIVLGHVVGMGITVWALKRLNFFK